MLKKVVLNEQLTQEFSRTVDEFRSDSGFYQRVFIVHEGSSLDKL
jgi:hypothetical protein